MSAMDELDQLDVDAATALLLTALEGLDKDTRITPQTVIELTPVNIPWSTAKAALIDLSQAGLLHRMSETRRHVYALRPDLPLVGDGHVWMRYDNRRGAVIEIIGDQPPPANQSMRHTFRTIWRCSGCGDTADAPALASTTDRGAQGHAASCRALPARL